MYNFTITIENESGSLYTRTKTFNTYFEFQQFMGSIPSIVEHSKPLCAGLFMDYVKDPNKGQTENPLV